MRWICAKAGLSQRALSSFATPRPSRAITCDVGRVGDDEVDTGRPHPPYDVHTVAMHDAVESGGFGNVECAWRSIVSPCSIWFLVASADATLASPRAGGSKVKRIVRHRGINGGPESNDRRASWRTPCRGETVYAAKGRRICLSARTQRVLRNITGGSRAKGERACLAGDNPCGIVTRKGEDAESAK
jgi:hypothetical protein